jgi:branched-chain amino acid transport system substrate-binding protein
MDIRRTLKTIFALASVVITTALASAAEQTVPGVSDTEIKIGNTMPYSGPASAYGIIGKTEAAYFDMLNEQGGINGRKINFISRDDGYSPPKTFEQVRQLYLFLRGPTNGMTPSTFLGPWVGYRAMAPRRISTRGTS